MLCASPALLALALQLPPNSSVVDTTWNANESVLAQREACAVLADGDVFWTRTGTDPETAPSQLYVDLFRTQRITLDGQVLWTDSEFGFTEGDFKWPEPLGRLPQSWPVDEAAGSVFIALPVNGELVIKCLDVDDGSLRWESRVPDPSTPAGYTVVEAVLFDSVGERLIVLAQRSQLEVRVHDAVSGDLLWTDAYSSGGSSALGLDTEAAFVPGTDSFVVATVTGPGIPRAQLRQYDLNTQQGVLLNSDLWADQLGLAVSPDGTRVALATNGGPGPRVAQIDLASGAVEWQRLQPHLDLDGNPKAAFDPSGERVLATATRTADDTLGQDDLGAQLTCVDSATGQVLWSQARTTLESSVADPSAGADLAFLIGGELHWSYPLPTSEGFVSNRERVSIADGSSLGAASGGASIFPERTLGVTPGGEWVQLGRDLLSTLVESEFSYNLQIERFDPTSLANQGTAAGVLLGSDSSSILAAQVSADGRRGAALVAGLDSSNPRLVAVDLETAQVAWELDASQQFNVDLEVLELDPSGRWVFLLRSSTSSANGISRASLFDFDSGSLLWEQDYEPGLAGAGVQVREGSKLAVLTEDELVLLTPNGNSLDLSVLEPETGAVRWSNNLFEFSLDSPVLDVLGDSVYAISLEGSLPFGGVQAALTRYRLSDGVQTAQLPLPGFVRVELLAVKPEGIFVGRTGAGSGTGLLVAPDLSGIDFEFPEGQRAVFKLGPLEGFLRVGVGFVQQTGDVPRPGEDLADEFNWIVANAFLGGSDLLALFDERRQLLWYDAGFSAEAQAFDTATGQVMWTGESPLVGFATWDDLLPVQAEVGALFGAYESESVINPGVPFQNYFTRVELPELILRTEGLSASAGGQAELYLRGNRPDPGELDLKVVLGSLATASPGIPVGAFEVPFPIDDPLLVCSLLDCAPAVLQGLQGSLDPAGLGRARIDLPPGLGPEWVGQMVNWTWLQLDPTTLAVELVAPLVSVTLGD